MYQYLLIVSWFDASSLLFLEIPFEHEKQEYVKNQATETKTKFC